MWEICSVPGSTYCSLCNVGSYSKKAGDYFIDRQSYHSLPVLKIHSLAGATTCSLCDAGTSAPLAGKEFLSTIFQRTAKFWSFSIQGHKVVVLAQPAALQMHQVGTDRCQSRNHWLLDIAMQDPPIVPFAPPLHIRRVQVSDYNIKHLSFFGFLSGSGCLRLLP